MSTDLPKDAIDHGIAQELIFADGTKWWGGGIDYRIVAIPVPAPEPPSLAERMEAWDRDDPITPSGAWHDRIVYQRMIDDLGLVCRDEVPTVTQVRDAIRKRVTAAGRWDTLDAPSVEWVTHQAAAAAVDIGAARPDQEPDT